MQRIPGFWRMGDPGLEPGTSSLSGTPFVPSSPLDSHLIPANRHDGAGGRGLEGTGGDKLVAPSWPHDRGSRAGRRMTRKPTSCRRYGQTRTLRRPAAAPLRASRRPPRALARGRARQSRARTCPGSGGDCDRAAARHSEPSAPHAEAATRSCGEGRRGRRPPGHRWPAGGRTSARAKLSQVFFVQWLPVCPGKISWSAAGRPAAILSSRRSAPSGSRRRTVRVLCVLVGARWPAEIGALDQQRPLPNIPQRSASASCGRTPEYASTEIRVASRWRVYGVPGGCAM